MLPRLKERVFHVTTPQGYAGILSHGFYGTTTNGGAYGNGNVYKVTPTPSGKRWKETVLHVYKSPGGPWGGLVIDGVGTLYGTTQGDGNTSFGSVFEITP